MSLTKRLALFFFLLSAAGASAANAQIAIYGMGSGAFLGSTTATQGSLVESNGGFSAYGGTFGVYDDFLHAGPLHLGADARYFQEASSNNNSYGNKMHGGLAGLRLDLHLPAVPFKPYIQAEVGGVGTNYGVQASDAGAFAYQVQGGLDFTIFPHLDVRGEYGGGQIHGYGGNQQALQEVGVGLVVRFF